MSSLCTAQVGECAFNSVSSIAEQSQPFVAPVTKEPTELSCSVVVVDVELPVRVCPAQSADVSLLDKYSDLVLDGEAIGGEGEFSGAHDASAFDPALASVELVAGRFSVAVEFCPPERVGPLPFCVTGVALFEFRVIAGSAPAGDVRNSVWVAGRSFGLWVLRGVANEAQPFCCVSALGVAGGLLVVFPHVQLFSSFDSNSEVVSVKLEEYFFAP